MIVLSNFLQLEMF